jgi:predicted negative regulator of RcsB-dependent stress response
MKEGLLIGGGIVVAGVFVGYVAYKLVQKNPIALNSVKKKASNVVKKTSKVASDAKRAFAEGFESAQAKTATA